MSHDNQAIARLARLLIHTSSHAPPQQHSRRIRYLHHVNAGASELCMLKLPRGFKTNQFYSNVQRLMAPIIITCPQIFSQSTCAHRFTEEEREVDEEEEEEVVEEVQQLNSAYHSPATRRRPP